MSQTTILMYGRSRSGKSTQIGELAEHIYNTEGLKTRLYTADRGGIDPIRPHVELGIIDVIAQENSNPWIFLNNAVHGRTRNSDGKWVEGDHSKIGMFAFESMTAFADALMASLAAKSAAGVNVGGGSNISFTEAGDDQTLKIGGSNVAHYGVVQTRITDDVWTSQRLPSKYVFWTASASKDDDSTTTAKVLGPQVVGKALTSEVPRWFNLTFRIDGVPAQMGKPERHILYLGNSVDTTAGGAIGLGNTRVPKDAPELPPSIEPASIVKALQLIEGSQQAALDVLRKRMRPAK